MIELRCPQLAAPILALQGGADQGIPTRTTSRSSRRWRPPARTTSSIEFEGAPHSFFDRKQEEFQAASDDAWQRTLAFIEAHS